MRNNLISLAAMICSTVGAGVAHASYCTYPEGTQTLVVQGTAPTFAGTQVPYQLGSLKIETRCETGSTNGGCVMEDGDLVCSSGQYAYDAFKVSIGDQVGSLTGPPTTSWWPAVETAPSSTPDWEYASTTIEGNSTEIWFKWITTNKVQVIFRVTANGNVSTSDLLTFGPRSFSHIGNLPGSP
jgi:hypothetical protein